MTGWPARAGLAVASLLLTLLALEAGARLAFPYWRGLVAQRFMAEHSSGALAGVPNFSGRVAGLWGDFDVSLELDGRGFRNPPDADPAAPLIFVGDSFCQGWGVEREQAYATRVAAQLGIAAYNYCTVGADLLDDLRVLQAWMPPRQGGATVLTVTFENDVLAYPEVPERAPTDSVQGLSRNPISRWLMHHSALFDVGTTLARQSPAIVAAVRRLGLVSGVPITASGADPIAASVRMVERIRQAAGGGPFLVVLVPPRPGEVPFNDVDAFVRALRAARIAVLDPREHAIPITLIPYDGHWDAAMHEAVAPLIAARLAELVQPRT
jgi:hypothetical protein